MKPLTSLSHPAPSRAAIRRYSLRVFRGWVPSITGRLSFSVIGGDDGRRTKAANLSDFEQRFLLAYERRNTSDSIIFDLFPKRLGNLAQRLAAKFKAPAGKMDFVIAARSVSSGGEKFEALSGALFAFAPGGAWEKRKFAFSELRKNLNNAGSSDLASIRPVGHHTIRTAIRLGQKEADIFCLFRLERTGELRLVFSQGLQKQAQAPIFPGTTPKKDMVHDAISQLYFFLKDISHKHYHHSGRSDTTIDILEDAESKIWRREILYSLFRKIVSLRRHGTIYCLNQAQGILAYAKAFQDIFGEKYRFVPIVPRLPSYTTEPLIRSLISNKGEQNSSDEKKKSFLNRAQTLFFGTAALVISLTGLLSLYPERLRTYLLRESLSTDPKDLSICLANFLIESPLAFVVGLAVLIIGLSLPKLAHTGNVIRALSRLAIAWGRTSAVLFFSSLSATFLLIFLLMMYFLLF